MEILIKRYSTTVLTVSPLPASDYLRALMGDDIATLVWEQSSHTALNVGDYITYDGRKFTLNALPTIKKLSSKRFEYNAVFQSPIYDLSKANYMLFGSSGTPAQGDFSLTGTPYTFIALLVANLNRIFGAGVWSVGSVLDAEVKTLSFAGENCLTVLSRLAEEFDTEYSLTGKAVNLIEITNPASLTLQYGSTLYDIERKTIGSANIITRLYPFGGTQNIAATYRGGSTKLVLPDPLLYLQTNTTLYGVIEGQKTFDDIYPRLGATAAGTITAIGADIFTVSDSHLDFDLNAYLMPGTPAKLRFLTGECAGYDLEIASFNNTTKTYKLIVNEDDKGFKIPNASLFPAIGDTYVLLDVIMPAAYVTAAEAELLAKAEEYLLENAQPKVSYAVTFSAIWAKENAPDIQPGDLVTVSDADLGINADLRVVKINTGITDNYNIKVDLSDTVSKSTLTRIAAELAANTQGITKANDGLKQQFSRNWRNVEELSAMIDTLRADMLLIGSTEGQFELLSTLFTPNYQNDKNKFYATAGSLVHKTIPSEESPGTWAIPAYAPALTTDATAYYLYAKCGRTGGTGVYLLSASAIAYDSDPTYYHFLIGVLSSVNAGARTLQTTYGFTQITGKSLTTGTIQSADASTYFDLDTGEIGGNLKFKSGSTYKEVGAGISEAQIAAKLYADQLKEESLADYNAKFATMQAQVDGEVSNWFYSGEPTGANNPETLEDWDTPAKKTAHIGDTYTCIDSYEDNPTSAGKSWRYSTEFTWVPIADSDAVLALQKAATAQSTADGKSTTFFVQPTSYKKGDVWILAADWNTFKSGEMLFASQDSASFVSGHWVKKVMYTDNTVANAALTAATNAKSSADTANTMLSEWASDNKLNPSEKQATLKEWNIIVAEKLQIDSQADIYSVSKVSYQTSYTNLYNYLYVENSLLTDLNTTTPIDGIDFRYKFAAYYSARQSLLNAIAQKAKDYVVDSINGIVIGGRNLVKNSMDKRVSSFATYNDKLTEILEYGKEYILSAKINVDPLLVKYYLREWATGYSNIQYIPHGQPFTVASNNLDTIVIVNEGNNFEYEISYVKLEKGNKATDWTAAPEDVHAEINETKQVLSDLANDTIITPAEKQDLKRIMEKIAIEYNSLRARCPGYLDGILETLDDYYVLLNSYISPFLVNMTVNSTGIVPATFNAMFSDYYIRYEDVARQISEYNTNNALASAYLQEAIQAENTTINGGLLGTTILQLKNGATNLITGGLSGLTADNIGFWTGGTYGDALAGKAKTLLRKDGAGHFAGGNLSWDVLGKLLFGKSTSGNTLSISTDLIPTLAQIENKERVDVPVYNVNTVIDYYNPAHVPSTMNRIYVKEFELINDSIVTIDAAAGYSWGSGVIGFSPIISMKIEKELSGAWYSYVDGTVESSTGSYAKVINIISNWNLEKGKYRVKWECSCSYSYLSAGDKTATLSEYCKIDYQLKVKKVSVGIDGIALSDSMTDNYVRMSMSDLYYILDLIGGVRLKSPDTLKSFELTNSGIKAIGAADIPAGLGGASISSAGGISANWGKIAATSQVAKSGSNYTITHNIGDTYYSLILTPLSTSVPYFSSKSSNTVTVTCAGGFDFILIRTK